MAQVPATPRAGRRVPAVVVQAKLDAPDLESWTVPLPEADTLSEVSHARGMLSRIDREDGSIAFHVPQVVLVKFRQARYVAALRVESMRELEAIEKLTARPDVAFAELDILQQRQILPDDPELTNQWHHLTIGSYEAWNTTLGSPAIRIGIVDAPFQMDHPDLVANTDPGWSVISNAVITASAGIDHSTAGAGMAAAVIHNALGIAGIGNSRVVPVHIAGFTSDMYDAILWCADHDVRVVNISWSGADSPTLNDAGLYLKSRARGVLVMSGVNGTGPLNYPDHPDIQCVSMTDQADNLRSHSGDHIDFAAPGYQVYTTLTGSGYGMATGTSFSTPLVAGVLAVLLGVNPSLSSDEVTELLRTTTEDLGPAGRDPFFGWGRIDFARALEAAVSTLPRIQAVTRAGGVVTVTAGYRPGLEHALWKASRLTSPQWSAITNGTSTVNGTTIELTDPQADADTAYYRVRVDSP